MRCQRDGFVLPTPQTEQGPDAESAKASPIRSFRRIQPIIEVALWSSRVQVGINAALIRFLINNQTFGAGAHDRDVIVGFHWADLDCDGRKHWRERPNTFNQ